MLARRTGDAERLARAALGLGAGLGGFEVQLLDPLQVDLLEEALAALGPDPSPLRAWVLARLSVALSFMADESRRRSLSEEAVAVARAAGDPRALGYALAAHCDASSGPDACDDRVTALGRDRPAGSRRPATASSNCSACGFGSSRCWRSAISVRPT